MAAYYRCKAMLCYTFGEYEEAWSYIKQCEKKEGVYFALPALVWCAFYRVLIASQLLCDGSDEKQLRRSLAQGVSKLRKWARACPENFASRYLLAEAEAARSAGRDAEAISGYRSALAAARQSGALGIEALAHELWARFLRARGEPTEARERLRLAIEAYERWGRWQRHGISSTAKLWSNCAYSGSPLATMSSSPLVAIEYTPATLWCTSGVVHTRHGTPNRSLGNRPLGCKERMNALSSSQNC
jgi:hypothetical protein